MFLAVDIGNTSINFGIFEDDGLIKTFRLSSDMVNTNYYEELSYRITDKCKIENCAIISVVNGAGPGIKKICDDLFGINSVILDDNFVQDMKILTKHPEKTGIDRIINAYAVRDYGRFPAVVVDAGTAVTFDVLSSDGDFIGGAIMPGVSTQLKSLHNSTSELPLVTEKESDSAIGDDTESSVIAGVIRGTAYAADGMLMQYGAELGEKPLLVMTGGHSEMLLKYMKTKFDYVLPDLTICGIKKAFEQTENKED